MPLLRENRAVNMPRRPGKTSLPLSAVDVNGLTRKMGMVKPIDSKMIKRQRLEKPTEFLTWNLPEQDSGYIKCREHDFF